MSELEAKVRRWFDVVHARDFDSLAETYSTDATYVRSDGISTGRDEIVGYLRGIMDGFPDHASRLDAILVCGNAVTVEWTETATHTQTFIGLLGEIPPTGRSFEARVVEIFRFDGEQISSQHEYYDLLGLLTQLGWMERFIAAMTPSASPQI